MCMFAENQVNPGFHWILRKNAKIISMEILQSPGLQKICKSYGIGLSLRESCQSSATYDLWLKAES